jgi:hypothetical protein
MLSIEDNLKLGAKARFMKAVRELRGYYYVYYCPVQDEEEKYPSEYFRTLSEFTAKK